MTTSRRFRRIVPLAIVAAGSLIAGCASGPPSPLPTTSAGAALGSPSASTVTPAIPTASSVAVATPVETSGPATPAASCPPLPQTVELPSDRLTDVRVATSADADRITFVFGDPSLPGPVGHPVATLEQATKPFTMAGSGAPVSVAGEHVVGVRFTRMSLANDAGQETYGGSRDVEPSLPALRQAVLYDEFEGTLGWYVGYDGSACPTLSATDSDIILTIAHP